MELSVAYMHKLGTTRMFSDFTFTVSGGDAHKVHKVILAAHSPVFLRFFQEQQGNEQQEADLFALFPNLTFDKFTKLAIRESMIDVFSYCYFGQYSSKPVHPTSNFSIRVLSHLLTLSLASHLELPALVEHAHMHFIAAFVDFDSTSTSEEVQAALKKCFSAEFLQDQGLSEQALNILREVAFEAFAEQVGKLKREGRWKEVVELMESVPGAAARMYSGGALGVGGDEVEEEEREEDDGEEEETVVGETDGTEESRAEVM